MPADGTYTIERGQGRSWEKFGNSSGHCAVVGRGNVDIVDDGDDLEADSAIPWCSFAPFVDSLPPNL
jgi:hypothetical protein